MMKDMAGAIDGSVDLYEGATVADSGSDESFAPGVGTTTTATRVPEPRHDAVLTTRA
jgi:hypothetical protein